MKHFLLLLLLTTSLLPQSLFDKIGGASSKNPEDFIQKQVLEAIELVKEKLRRIRRYQDKRLSHSYCRN
ncbi:MAG: hypothetical protein IPL26_05050 [Leptospiraceae bacterium]|nr:hypothetical protein [Leptospiraceae bacterium]